MAARKPAQKQPANFAWNTKNRQWCDTQMQKYPKERQASAVIAFLWQAQKQEGWVSIAAMEVIAGQLNMPYIRVYEVATFYTMFNLSPVGKYFVQLCGTTPCMLRGANDLKEACTEVIGSENVVNATGNLSWQEVECLGACCNAPMVQINDYYYQDLSKETFTDILGKLDRGEHVAPGVFNPNRHTSDPEGGATTLNDPVLYDGTAIRAISVLPNMLGKMKEPT